MVLIAVDAAVQRFLATARRMKTAGAASLGEKPQRVKFDKRKIADIRGRALALTELY
jgi:hypothetical protein